MGRARADGGEARAWSLGAPAGVHARLGRRLRPHGHRRTVRARPTPRPQRDELAPAPVLARRVGHGGGRADAGSGAGRRRRARRDQRGGPLSGDEGGGRPPGGGDGGDGDRHGPPVECVARRRDGAGGVVRRHRCGCGDHPGSRGRAPLVGGGAAGGSPVALRGLAGVRADGRPGPVAPWVRAPSGGRQRASGDGRTGGLDGLERARARERTALRGPRDHLPARHRRRRRPALREAAGLPAGAPPRDPRGGRPRPGRRGGSGPPCAAGALALGGRGSPRHPGLPGVGRRPRRGADASPGACAGRHLVDPGGDGRRRAGDPGRPPGHEEPPCPGAGGGGSGSDCLVRVAPWALGRGPGRERRRTARRPPAPSSISRCWPRGERRSEPRSPHAPTSRSPPLALSSSSAESETFPVRHPIRSETCPRAPPSWLGPRWPRSSSWLGRATHGPEASLRLSVRRASATAPATTTGHETGASARPTAT